MYRIVNRKACKMQAAAHQRPTRTAMIWTSTQTKKTVQCIKSKQVYIHMFEEQFHTRWYPKAPHNITEAS
jgi:hypothetical protein